MSKSAAPEESNPHFTGSTSRGRRIFASALGAVVGVLLSGPVLAGGANVSADPVGEDTDTDDVALQSINAMGITGGMIDINADGNADLIIATNKVGAAGRSRYYLGNGDGTFQAFTFLGVAGDAGRSSEALFVDLNENMELDVFLGLRDEPNIIFPGDGAGGLLASVQASANTDRTLAIAVGDLDNDGDLDFVAGNGRFDGDPDNPAQPNVACENDGLGVFTCNQISADADDTRSIALADMDVDGDLDVIVGNDETTPGSNRIYSNQFVESGMTNVSFAAGFDFGDPNDQTSKILIGDLNNDTLPDIVTLNNVVPPANTPPMGINGANRYFLNANVTPGTLALAPVVDVSADADKSSGGVLADFDGDGDFDIAVANLQLNQPTPDAGARDSLYLNQFVPNGTVSFSAAQDIGANAAGTSADEFQSRELDAVDLNGDGFPDIVVGNDEGQPDRRYLNNGTATPFQNVAPVIDGQAALDTDEDTDITIDIADVTVTDDDNVFPADFTLAVQDGMNYTHVGNVITPAANFSGALTVPVTVNDGTDDSAAFNLTVTVNEISDGGPTITSTAITTATEGVGYIYNITVTDPDPADTITITAPTLPASGWLTIMDNGGGSATLMGTPMMADVGPNDVVIQATDGTTPVMQMFTIDVMAAGAGNTPPVIDSMPVTDATEGQVYTYNITTMDPDMGDTITLTDTTVPAWLMFTDNLDGTATLTGMPDAGDVGMHPVEIGVADQVAPGTPQTFTITVAAAPNAAPTFTSMPVTDATVDMAYSYAITTEDTDGDPVTITALSALPAWLTLTDNMDGTATLAGTPAAGDVGDVAVSLQVSDGMATAMHDFTITVAPAGGGDTTPPVITLIGPAVVDVDLNSVYNDMGATAMDDIDGDITSQIVTTSNVDTSTVGTYMVSYDVSDSSGNAATTVTRTVNVVDPLADTTAPVITLIGPAVVNVTLNSPYMDMGAMAMDDVDGDISSQIVVTDNVDTSAVGTYTVRYNVSDAAGNAATEVTRQVMVSAPRTDGGGGGSLGLLSLLAMFGMAGAVKGRRGGSAA